MNLVALTDYGFKLYDGSVSCIKEPEYRLKSFRIKMEPKNIYVYQSHVDLDQVTSIRSKPMMPAILVDELENGNYLVLDGHHRLLAKLLSGYNVISVRKRD